MVGVTLREAMRAEERAFDTLAKVRDGRYCAAVVEQCERHANAARERRIAIQRAVAAAAQERHRAAVGCDFAAPGPVERSVRVVSEGKVLVTPSNSSHLRDSGPGAR